MYGKHQRSLNVLYIHLQPNGRLSVLPNGLSLRKIPSVRVAKGRKPVGRYVILIGIGGAAHQSWSANIFSTVGDMFPRTAIASITGIGGMAGGIGSMILQKVAGNLFVYASGTTMLDGKEVEMTKDLLEQGAQFVHPAMTFMGFEGKPAGYFVIFCVCAVAYLIGWVIMKALVPKYKPIVLD